MEGERKEVRACAKILQTGRMSRKIQGWVELGERMRMVAVAGVGRVREGEEGGGGLARREGVRACAKSAPLPPPTIDTDAYFVISQIYGNNKNQPASFSLVPTTELFHRSRGQCSCLS